MNYKDSKNHHKNNQKNEDLTFILKKILSGH